MKRQPGDRFGSFELVGLVEPYVSLSGRKLLRWLVKCTSCGKEKKVLSCGLKRFKGVCNNCLKLSENEIVGRWTLLSETTYTAPSAGEPRRAWLCRCQCGTTRVIAEGTLKFSSSKSCGCLSAELKTTHGATGSRELSIYLKMLNRCSEKASDSDKAYYHDKGIRVSDRWLESFENFFEDMGECSDNFSIERLDSNKGYSKENCVWADDFTQASNRGKFSNNTSGKTGVCWDKSDERWRVSLHYKGVKYDGGRFEKYEEACKKREQLELQVIGKLKGH